MGLLTIVFDLPSLQMQRKFLINLLFLLFLNLLIKPFWIFGIDRTVQNTLGAEEYGIYYALFGFSILLNIILDVGITNYNNRNIAQHNHMLGRYFSSIVMLKLLLGVAYLIATLVFAFLFDYQGKELVLLLVLCLNQFLVSFLLYLRSNIAGLQLFKWDSFLSVLDRITMIAICGTMLWGITDFKFTIEHFVWAQTFAYVLSCIVAVLILGDRLTAFKLKFNIPLLRVIFKQSMPFALLVLLMAFYYRVDSVMIERLLPNGREQAGIYAQAYRLLEASTTIGYLFAGLLLPMFSKMISTKESPSELIKLSFNLIFIPAITLFGVCFFYASEIMEMLYFENTIESAKVLQVLMLNFVAIASTYIFGTFLTANGSLKALNSIAIVGLLINLILNFILIPKYASYGAAVATLITQIFVIVAQVIVVKRILKWKTHLNYVIRMGFFLTLFFAISYFISIRTLDWLLQSTLTIAAGGTLALSLKLIEPKSMLQILKNKAGN